MLSDRERHVLQDIENELGTNDPELAERLSGEALSAHSKVRHYWVAAGVLGLLLLITMAADMPVATLILAIAAISVVTIGYKRFRKSGVG